MNKTVLEGEKHFCASVWIVTRTNPKKILLLHHKKLERWLQPGGHIEKFENPVEAAIREVREETGIDISNLTQQIQIVDNDGTFLPIPKFVMEQTIPRHKDQPQHFHLDLQYVVELEEQKTRYNKAESHDIGWFTKEEALSLSIHEDTKAIINQLL